MALASDNMNISLFHFQMNDMPLIHTSCESGITPMESMELIQWKVVREKNQDDCVVLLQCGIVQLTIQISLII